ncbi:MAG: tRNA dihydrouridine(20/20a) synthase DusA [Proteobacteria bacterium]|nr:tRNA dihydrouridine(20/20a) synthase DusA [Pseudomonadota bacterium]
MIMTKSVTNHKICIAPMMDHTDKHFRYFMRLLSKNTVLYTEMITTGAIIHGDRNRILEFNEIEHPLAIQLGGNRPEELAESAHIAENEGYDEINLNIGCPSDRVQNGQFGACLMSKPELVANCVSEVLSKVHLPVTVKTRIGIDEQDSYEFLKSFVTSVSNAGCNTFIIHARKAILSGLSPKENREIPPLHYDRVYQLKSDFPSLNIVINGGITNLNQVKNHLQYVDGVMLGRIAYQNPYMLSLADRLFFESSAIIPSRQEILENYKYYIDKQIKNGIHPKNLTRHIIGLFQGQPGARQYRRLLSETKPESVNDTSYFDEAIRLVSNH